MTCPECELLLAQGGAMSEAALDHLRVCEACRAMQYELEENAEALSALRLDAVPAASPKRAFPWISAVAAAAVVAIVSMQVWQWKPTPPKPLRLKAEEPQEVTVAVKAPPPPIIARARAGRPKASGPLKIKMLTGDPDVVVYWLVDY